MWALDLLIHKSYTQFAAIALSIASNCRVYHPHDWRPYPTPKPFGYERLHFRFCHQCTVVVAPRACGHAAQTEALLVTVARRKRLQQRGNGQDPATTPHSARLSWTATAKMRWWCWLASPPIAAAYRCSTRVAASRQMVVAACQWTNAACPSTPTMARLMTQDFSPTTRTIDRTSMRNSCRPMPLAPNAPCPWTLSPPPTLAS